MNNLKIVLVLTFISIQSTAISMGNFKKEIIDHINNPMAYIKQNKNKDYWFAYNVANQPNSPSNCCWNQDHNGNNSSQTCDLNKKISGFGNHNKNSYSQNNSIFVHVEKHNIVQVLPIGEKCEIKADGIYISWLQDVTEADSIEFLMQVIMQQPKQPSHNSMFALALHQDNMASKELYKIALMEKHDMSNEAVFWLGEARNDGLKQLQSLYNKLPKGEVKRHINFSLSLLKDNQGLDFLEQIALNDKEAEQRSDALFWISQKSPNKAKDIILKQFNQTNKLFDTDKLVFTLSQLSNGQGDDSLFQLLQGSYSLEIKKQALFWLSQSEDTKTIDKLQKLL